MAEAKPVEGTPISTLRRVVEVIVLAFTTLFTLVVAVSAGVTSASVANRGVNGAGLPRNFSTTQITPPSWTFSVWFVIFTWQFLWIGYAWSLVCRPRTQRIISWITLLLYNLANASGFIWTFLYQVGGYRQAAFPFIFFHWIFLLAAIGVQSVRIQKVAPLLSPGVWGKVDLWMARLVVVNGMALYATWLTGATLLNFATVLQDYANVDPGTTGTVMLWLLTLEVAAYFALENTVLDRYLRYVFIVYPTFMWTLIGIVSDHWGMEESNTNPLLTLLILILIIVLFIVRIVFWIVFPFVRQPIDSPSTAKQDHKLLETQKSEQTPI